MGISTHILDTTLGKPAAGVAVRLERRDDARFVTVSAGQTDADGRAKLVVDPPAPGHYQIRFEVAAYFERLGVEGFYPEVAIQFLVREGAGSHYHVPLLLNPFGYSTYRGS